MLRWYGFHKRNNVSKHYSKTPVPSNSGKADSKIARYKSSSEITSLTATFPYLTAVIQEALRMYPPVPFGMPRVVPKGGETVDGLSVPGGVSSSVVVIDPS
jgi:cytochrome P450